MKITSNTIGTKVPFFPAIREFEAIKTELVDAFIDTGESGQLILGPKVKQFEQKMTEFIQAKYCISCANGTDALTLALKSLNLTSEDEVIVPANSYPTVFGVALSGVKLVLADVDSETGNLTAESLEKRISANTKAVIVVYLYGQAADIVKIMSVCKSHNLYLVEDCAQAFGAKYQSKLLGSFGDIATFSFYPTKNLGAYGDGGAIVTSNLEIATHLRMLRTYGESSRYQSEELGHNSRLDELQAAILLKKLDHIKHWLEKRNALATLYRKGLEGVADIVLPNTSVDGSHTYHLFPIKTVWRDELKVRLSDKGIETGIHYPYPIHSIQTFKELGEKGDFPHAENWSAQELSLPMHPYLVEDEINHVIESIKAFFKKKNKE